MGPLLALGLGLATAGAGPRNPVEPPSPELTGVWAEKQVLTGTTDLPVVGEIVAINRTLLRVEVKQEGRRIDRVETVCAIDSRSSIGAVKTVLPPAFLKAVSGLRRRGTLSVRGGTWRLKTAKALGVYGAKLKQPAGDPLPEEDDDERLVDDDGDGHPGVTIRLEGPISGDLYMVERDWSVLLGVLVGGNTDHVKGRLVWGSEQSVVDSTNPLLTGPRSLAPHRDSRRSSFEMRKVAPKTTCEDIIAKAGSLFGQ